jgi:spore coat protein JC
MWIYQKKLEFPVNITTPDLRVARALMAQYGGPRTCSRLPLSDTALLYAG